MTALKIRVIFNDSEWNSDYDSDFHYSEVKS